MNVGILGLGLIGGSLARAYAKAGHTVYVHDLDNQMLAYARISGVIHGLLDISSLRNCQLIFLAVYSAASASWLKENAEYIDPNTVVIDCCGIKKEICEKCFPLAEEFGFTFVGGHPMAGSHYSGFKYSRSNLFQGAPMVLVPPRFDDPLLLSRVIELLSPCGFGSYSVTTAEEHDQMIAFTSQMPHIVSNAFIKSPTAGRHKGFSAGSYKDLTRVAWLNAKMWSELFLSNRENILSELDFYINSLCQYKEAIEKNDAETLYNLLDEGRRKKEEVDG